MCRSAASAHLNATFGIIAAYDGSGGGDDRFGNLILIDFDLLCIVIVLRCLCIVGACADICVVHVHVCVIIRAYIEAAGQSTIVIERIGKQ